MAKRKVMRNGFTPKEASAVVGLSLHMLNYLARHGYLKPHYGSSGRGRTRYYSYRDLVVARIIARLLDAGLEISRLKAGITKLAARSDWNSGDDEENIRLLATDGTRLFFKDREGLVRDLSEDGQLAFAFVLNVKTIREEVLMQLDEQRKTGFTLANLKLLPAEANLAS